MVGDKSPAAWLVRGNPRPQAKGSAGIAELDATRHVAVDSLQRRRITEMLHSEHGATLAAAQRIAATLGNVLHLRLMHVTEQVRDEAPGRLDLTFAVRLAFG